MIAEKILGNLSENTPSVEVDTVELDWFEAEKKRIRKTTAGGRDIGIAIDENLKINVHTMQEMGRLCFEIGNRHLSLKISDDNVLIPHDEPTEKHLKNLGFECENIIGRFDDFIVCKAHGHSHSHSHEHGEHHHHEHSH